MGIGIALDLGSSGFRAHAVDLSEGDILMGASTLCHPLPGGNVVDHILFSLTYGHGLAHDIVMGTINKLIESITMPKEVELIAVCGNPIQLSIFTNGELRDLAFSPDAMMRKGICVPTRDGQILDAKSLGLNARCDVLVPPSIKAEVGADAIAMIIKSGMIQKKLAIAIDFGTNAEMALKSEGCIFVGSAAAGPAIEGQHISHGMLAAPGAICDMEYDWGWKCKVLDEQMLPKDGDTVDFTERKMITKRNIHAVGITGTGIIALISIGLGAGYIDPPHIAINSGKLSLQDGIEFGEEDLLEAGKAFGAMSAGEKTLASSAGISLEEIDDCFMAGAAGSYADPYKARDVGLIPSNTRIVHQLGNTSLEMAADLVSGKETLEGMHKIADWTKHISFSTSETFKQNYLSEYAYWCEGARYPKKKAGPTADRSAMEIVRAVKNVARIPTKYFRLIYCIPFLKSHEQCIQICPRKALLPRDGCFELNLQRCQGASCLRCEHACSGFKLGVNRVEILEV